MAVGGDEPQALRRRLAARARLIAERSYAAPGSLLGALADAEERHARALAGLPIAIASDVNDAARGVAPALARACVALEEFLAATAAASARVGPALRAVVGDALAQVKEQHERRAALLLAELDEALEKEHAFDVARIGLLAESDGGDDREVVAEGARQLRRKRDVERRAIATVAGQLRAEDRRRMRELAGLTGDALRAYQDLLEGARRQLATLRGQLRTDREREAEIINPANQACHDDDGEEGDSDVEKVARAAVKCEVFLAMLSWVNEVFVKMAAVEEECVQRLRKQARANKSSFLFAIVAGDNDGERPEDDSSCATTTDDRDDSIGLIDVSTLLSELAHYHEMRAVNLLDPISRTLKYSHRKLSQTHKELRDALQDTQKRVAKARSTVDARYSRIPSHDAKDWLSAVTTSEKASSAAVETFTTNLANFAMRGARMASKAARLPRSSVTMTASFSELSDVADSQDEDQDNNNVSTAGEESDLDRQKSNDVDKLSKTKTTKISSKDVDKMLSALDHLRSLEQQESEQSVDFVRSLDSTFRLAVNTVELIINDHCKHLDAALLALELAVSQPRISSISTGSESKASQPETLDDVLDELVQKYEDQSCDDEPQLNREIEGEGQLRASTPLKPLFENVDLQWCIRAAKLARDRSRGWVVDEIESAGCRTVWPCWLAIAFLLIIRICFHVGSIEGAMAQTRRLQNENAQDLAQLIAKMQHAI